MDHFSIKWIYWIAFKSQPGCGAKNTLIVNDWWLIQIILYAGTGSFFSCLKFKTNQALKWKIYQKYFNYAVYVPKMKKVNKFSISGPWPKCNSNGNLLCWMWACASRYALINIGATNVRSPNCVAVCTRVPNMHIKMKLIICDPWGDLPYSAIQSNAATHFLPAVLTKFVYNE